MREGFDVSESVQFEKASENYLDCVIKPETFHELVEEYYHERDIHPKGISDRASEIESINNMIPRFYETIKLDEIKKLNYNITRVKRLYHSKLPNV